MHSHEFIPSIKKDIFFCKICSELSYKDRVCQSIPIGSLDGLNTDPLTLKFRPSTSIVNYKSPNHVKYLEVRLKGISKIKYLCNTFGLKSMILHKSICIMNQLFLQNEISIGNIDIICCLCVLIETQYNECCVSSILEQSFTKPENDILFYSSLRKSDEIINNNEKLIKHRVNLRGLFNYIKSNIKNCRYWEILCLKYLNFDLGRYSAYDYLLLFFKLGIFFCKERIDVLDKLKFCLNILDIIICNKRACDFSQYTFAMSIIKIVLENDNFFDKNIFKYIYGVDLSKSKYIKCSNLIKNILIVYVNNDYIHSTLNILNNIINFSLYNNNINQQMNNNKYYNNHSNIPKKQNMYNMDEKEENNNNNKGKFVLNSNNNDITNNYNMNNFELNKNIHYNSSNLNNNYIIICNNINNNSIGNNPDLQHDYKIINNNGMRNNFYFLNINNSISCCNDNFQ